MAKKYVKKCPNCSSLHVVPIMYRMPGSKMQKSYMEGKIRLGGCAVTGEKKQADRYCKECEFKWNKDDKFCDTCGDVVMLCKCYEEKL